MMDKRSNRRYAFYWCLLFLFSFSSSWNNSMSCYIRNCPYGGKRSLPLTSVAEEEEAAKDDEETQFKTFRECMSCGARSDPCHCIGKRICCLEMSRGCYMDTLESRPCELEDLFVSLPCHVSEKFARCGADGSGICGTQHICCTEDGCVNTQECLSYENNANETIKANWDPKKGLKANLAQMGLVHNPNQISDKTPDIVPDKSHVVEELEKIANTVVPVKLSMSAPEMQFCKYMIEKYGDNYIAMARDIKNYFQDTPRQIERRITKYQKVLRQISGSRS